MRKLSFKEFNVIQVKLFTELNVSRDQILSLAKKISPFKNRKNTFTTYKIIKRILLIEQEMEMMKWNGEKYLSI